MSMRIVYSFEVINIRHNQGKREFKSVKFSYLARETFPKVANIFYAGQLISGTYSLQMLINRSDAIIRL